MYITTTDSIQIFLRMETCIFLVTFLIQCAFRRDKYCHLCYLCCLLALNHDSNDFYRKHSFKIYENVDYRTRIQQAQSLKMLASHWSFSIRNFCRFVGNGVTLIHFDSVSIYDEIEKFLKKRFNYDSLLSFDSIV